MGRIQLMFALNLYELQNMQDHFGKQHISELFFLAYIVMGRKKPRQMPTTPPAPLKMMTSSMLILYTFLTCLPLKTNTGYSLNIVFFFENFKIYFGL